MKLNMVMLGVEDLEKSREFYRDVLGLPAKNRAGDFAFIDAGEMTLVLSRPLGRRIHPRAGAVQTIFGVPHVRAAFEETRARGAQFLQEPNEVSPGAWAATFRDPDGHLLTLYGPE